MDFSCRRYSICTFTSKGVCISTSEPIYRSVNTYVCTWMSIRMLGDSSNVEIQRQIQQLREIPAHLVGCLSSKKTGNRPGRVFPSVLLSIIPERAKPKVEGGQRGKYESKQQNTSYRKTVTQYFNTKENLRNVANFNFFVLNKIKGK